MSLLSDKINSYAIETGISFDSAYAFPPVQTGTVTNTSAANWLLTGTAPVYESGVSPAGGAGSWKFTSNSSTGCRVRNTGTVMNAINDGDYSVGVWIKFNNLDYVGSPPMMAWQPAFTGGFLLSANYSSGKYNPVLNYATGAQINDFTTELNTTDWYYFALTKIGSELKFYINGVLKNTVTNAQTATATSLNFGQIYQGFTFSTNLANWYVASPSVVNAAAIAEIWKAGAGIKSFPTPLNRTTNSFPIEYGIEMNEGFTTAPTITGSSAPAPGTTTFTVTGATGNPVYSTLCPAGGRGSWRFPNSGSAGAGITSTSALTQTWADGDFSTGFWIMMPDLSGTYYGNSRNFFQLTSSGFDIVLGINETSGVWRFTRSINGAASFTNFGPTLNVNQWYYISIVKSNASNTITFKIDNANTTTDSLTASGTGGVIKFGIGNSLDSSQVYYISNFYMGSTTAVDSTAITTIDLVGRTTPGVIKYYDGAAFQTALNPYVYDGTKWVLWNSYRRLSDEWIPTV
jgi:hypothetical protein